MLRHYYTLHHVAEELRRLQGWFLTECFTQDKGVAMLCFESPSTRESVFVECSTDVQTGYVFLRPEFHRARKNTFDVFPTLIGHTLRGVELAQGERIISLHFAVGVLHCALFGGRRAAGYASGGNIVLTNAEGIITDAFKSPETLINTAFQPLPPNLRPFSAYASDTSLLATLSQCDILLGKVYAVEVLHRLANKTGIGLNVLLSATIDAARQVGYAELAEQMARALRDECLHSQEFFLCRDEEKKPFILLIPLHGYTAECTFMSISEALRTRIMLGLREQTFHTRRASILAATRSSLAKAERTLQNMARDHASIERAAERQMFAELLLSQPNVHVKGVRELPTQAWDGTAVVIPLNPALTLRENADAYFAKVRTANQSATTRAKRKAEYEHTAERARSLITALESAETLASLEKIMKEFGLQDTHAIAKNPYVVSHQGVQHKVQQQGTHKFREFDLGEGYTLYVGKAAADNDELTVRFAKPQDYWFHARGVAGSHAVLRGPHKDRKPPKYVVETAASIAAYYSKARNSKMTPVAYTQKKYVRKPKGAAPGAVVMEREDVVMAAPRLPQGTTE